MHILVIKNKTKDATNKGYAVLFVGLEEYTQQYFSLSFGLVNPNGKLIIIG